MNPNTPFKDSHQTTREKNKRRKKNDKPKTNPKQ